MAAFRPQGPGGGFDDFSYQANPQGYPLGSQVDPGNPLNDIIYGPASGFIQTGLGAYGQRVFGSGQEFVRSNMNKYFAGQEFGYYFRVNHGYVKNKLKVVLLPFLHKGHWTRIAEQVSGGLSYKPPRNDINAPDLYIPIMAFVTYLVLGGLVVGMRHKFNPGSVNAHVTQALIGWVIETGMLKGLLYSLAPSADAPLLDLVAYGGYVFVGVSATLLSYLLWHRSFYPVMIFTSLCLAMFLVKTMKRVLFAETRNYMSETSRHHYALLVMGALQVPIALYLGIV